MKVSTPLRVHIQGAGKIGRTFARGLRSAGFVVSLRASRRGVPERIDADVVLLSVRDSQLSAEASAWVRVVPSRAIVLHTAGALTADVIAVLRGSCRGVGQLHPLVSVASHRVPPSLVGAYALVSGDAIAVRVARSIARALGMKPRCGDKVDRCAYHAAAWLVAGGAAALCSAARDILSSAGIAPRQAERMLAPLLRSIAHNVEHLGMPDGLSGVVRRADLATLCKHVAVLSDVAPEHLALYLAAATAQIDMARALGEAAEGEIDALREGIVSFERGFGKNRSGF